MVLMSLLVWCQNENLVVDARNVAMGTATVALAQKQFSYSNPAVHSAEGLNLSFSESRMTTWAGGECRAAGMLSKAGSFTFGAGVWRFGDAVYNRQTLSGLLTHGISHTRLGLRLDINQFMADAQPIRRNMAFTVGGITSIHPRLTIGAFAENPGMAKIYGKPMAIRFSAGLAARPVPHLTLVSAVVQEMSSPAGWSVGLEYDYRDQVAVRMGAGIYPYRLSTGVGFRYWRVRADLSACYSYHTGISLQATTSVFPHRRKA